MGIDAGGHVFHIAAPKHQGMAVDDAVRRPLLKTVSNQLLYFHSSSIPFSLPVVLYRRMALPEEGYAREKENALNRFQTV